MKGARIERMERLPESVTAVMHFCPIDQNLLHITDRHRASDGEVYDGEVYDGNFRWYCLTCDYTYPIEEPVRIDVAVRPKEPGGIVGGEDAWSGAPETDGGGCERCGCKRAYYKEMQTRSADEPMTLFYKCKGCGELWKE